MFVLSAVLNIIASILFVWWSFGAINNVLLLIPAVVFFLVGSYCLIKMYRSKTKW